MALFEIAFALKKFVYEIEEMPYDELLGWYEYFDKNPVGWKEDYRTLRLMQVQGYKGNGEDIFHSLAYMSSTKKNSEVAKIHPSSFMMKLIKSSKGHRLED